MATISSIKRLNGVIGNSLFLISGDIGYSRTTDAIIAIANAINDYKGDTEDWCYIGESSHCCLSDLIVGAYWHYTEWHEGMTSKTYAALCALGEIYSTGMTSIDSEREDGSNAVFAYDMLEDMAGN